MDYEKELQDLGIVVSNENLKIKNKKEIDIIVKRKRTIKIFPFFLIIFCLAIGSCIVVLLQYNVVTSLVRERDFEIGNVSFISNTHSPGYVFENEVILFNNNQRYSIGPFIFRYSTGRVIEQRGIWSVDVLCFETNETFRIPLSSVLYIK